METSAIIVGIIIAFGLTLAVLWKLKIFPFKKDTSYRQDILPVAWPETFAEYHYTTQGVNCNFEVPLQPGDWERIEPIIDMGIRNLMRGYPSSWTRCRSHGDFRIGFIKPTATNMDGSPALIVSGVQTAGTVLGVTASFSPITICLPQQANWDYLNYLMHSVWFEGEHVAEFQNDLGLFWQYVGAGDSHPHRPIDNAEMPTTARTLMREAVKVVCGLK